jgi:hypothetical protein
LYRKKSVIGGCDLLFLPISSLQCKHQPSRDNITARHCPSQPARELWRSSGAASPLTSAVLARLLAATLPFVTGGSSRRVKALQAHLLTEQASGHESHVWPWTCALPLDGKPRPSTSPGPCLPHTWECGTYRNTLRRVTISGTAILVPRMRAQDKKVDARHCLFQRRPCPQPKQKKCGPPASLRAPWSPRKTGTAASLKRCVPCVLAVQNFLFFVTG